jgi:hypothetical protein
MHKPWGVGDYKTRESRQLAFTHKETIMLLSQKKAIAAMERGRKTALRADPRRKYRIEHITLELAIPFSLGAPGSAFTLGDIEFKLNHQKKIATPSRRLPESWLQELREIPVDDQSEDEVGLEFV